MRKKGIINKSRKKEDSEVWKKGERKERNVHRYISCWSLIRKTNNITEQKKMIKKILSKEGREERKEESKQGKREAEKRTLSFHEDQYSNNENKNKAQMKTKECRMRKKGKQEGRNIFCDSKNTKKKITTIKYKSSKIIRFT